MATARGTIDLGDIPSEDFNADLELRVAAVYGDAILGSTTVKAQDRAQPSRSRSSSSPSSIPARSFRAASALIVGPNVGDRELLSLDVAATTYQFEKSSAEAARQSVEEEGGDGAAAADVDPGARTRRGRHGARQSRVREAADRRRDDRGAPAHLPLLALVLPHLPHPRQGRLPQLDVRPDQAQVGLVRRPGPRRQGRHLRRRPLPLLVPRGPDHDGDDAVRRDVRGDDRLVLLAVPVAVGRLARSTRRSSATSASSCSSATSS